MNKTDSSLNILYINKQQFILNDIGDHYKEFENKAKSVYKINKILVKNNIVINQNDHFELLSDVIFSIVEKLKDPSQLDRFYLMAKENKLCFYIRRAIFINCFSLRAPFLHEKINKKRFLVFNNDKIKDLIEEKPMDSDTKKLKSMTEEQQELIKQVYKCLEPENAERIFGTHWKYFVQIFHDYMDNPKGTYKSISLKYGVPLTSIQNHLQIVYKKIREDLNKNKK